MKSVTTRAFRRRLRALPPDIRGQARAAYRRWIDNPNHPGLRFKRVSDGLPALYSVRITRDFRAVGELRDDTIYWQFIGNHDDYMRYLGVL